MDQGQATLKFEPKFLSTELNEIGLPVEVRNSKLKVVGRSKAPGSLQVKAPGKYYVLARLPAGQGITEEVEVQPLEVKTVSLVFDEEGIQPGVEEVSHYLGLPERTLLPTEVQTRSARRRSPVASPSVAPPVTATAADPGEIAAKSSRLESFRAPELAPEIAPALPSYDPVDQLLIEYASLTSPVTPLEVRGGVPPSPPAIIPMDVPAQRDLTPIDLYLRLFRGNALGLKTRALPANEWESGFQSGSKGNLKLSGSQEVSILQVIQPGRPTLNIMLPLGPAGCSVVIRRCAVSSPAAGSLNRDEVSFDVHMGNVTADFFLRYCAQGMLTEAAQVTQAFLDEQQKAVGQATQLLEYKFEDPVAAAVGAYGLLKFGNKERRTWINNLYKYFPWLPDAAALEGECLAREGKHEESLRTFLQLSDRGLPLFTDGLVFAVDRLELFTTVEGSSYDIKRARPLLELLRNYCQFVDLSKLICRYTGRMPHLPNADPASLSPELEKDPTVLSLTLEGGDDGVVKVKQERTRTAVRRPSFRSFEAQEDTTRSASSNRSTVRDSAVANLRQNNDSQSIALRVLHLASQSAETDSIAGVDDNLVLERIIRTSPEIGINFLELGNLAARTVARITGKQDARTIQSTGFMVSPHLLMTAHHILSDPESAANATVDFDYELDAAGRLKQSRTFTLRPDRFFFTDAALDFTLVCVADVSTDFVPLTEFGFNRLNGELGKILCGESITIIHHPLGGPKSLQLRTGVMRGYNENFLHYDAPTSPGSAGAPVFNDQWEVIGVHHSASPTTGSEGIRTSSILKACREVFLPNPGMQELLDQVFDPPEVFVSSSLAQPVNMPQLEPPPPLVPEELPELPKQTRRERS